MAFSSGLAAENATAMRVSITCQDGAEVDQVLHLGQAEEQRVNELEIAFSQLVGADERLGILAATRAIWNYLNADRLIQKDTQ